MYIIRVKIYVGLTQLYQVGQDHTEMESRLSMMSLFSMQYFDGRIRLYRILVYQFANRHGLLSHRS